MADTAFGKKKSHRPNTNRRVAEARHQHVSSPEAERSGEGGTLDDYESDLEEAGKFGIWRFLTETSFPYLTVALIALLIVVFYFEHVPAFGYSVLWAPKLPPLFANGVLTVQTVMAGQVWRIFTAPFLHDGMPELIVNGLWLFIAGSLFEQHVGRAWFMALFAGTSLAGSLGAVLLGGPDLVYTGSMAAAAGMSAAVFTSSFILEAEHLRSRMQRKVMRWLAPAMLPIAWPLLDGSFDLGDLAGPFGAVVVGGIAGYFLCEVWEEDQDHPSRPGIAWTIAGVYAALVAGSFAFLALI